MNAPSTAVAPRKQYTSLVEKFADKYTIEATKLLDILKATAFKQGPNDPPVTNEQMAALLVVSDQYDLNPFTKEIYAFPDKRGGIVPVVSVDGWARIINEHPQMDGVEFEDGPDGPRNGPESITCIMYRKDRSHPTKVRERMNECYRDTGPWKSHPSRMLRHKVLIQCARIAFGFAGIYDDDEAARIVELNPEAPGGTKAAETATTTTAKNAGDKTAEKLRQRKAAAQDAETVKPPEEPKPQEPAPSVGAGDPPELKRVDETMTVTKEQILGYIAGASDEEIASASLDMARPPALSKEDYAECVNAFNAKYKTVV